MKQMKRMVAEAQRIDAEKRGMRRVPVVDKEGGE